MRYTGTDPGMPGTWGTISGLQGTSTTNISNNSNMAKLTKPRDITIKPMANGYCVDIGCKTFVFESLDNLLYRIHEYYTDAAKVELHFESTNKLPVILSKKDKSIEKKR